MAEFYAYLIAQKSQFYYFANDKIHELKRKKEIIK